MLTQQELWQIFDPMNYSIKMLPNWLEIQKCTDLVESVDHDGFRNTDENIPSD